MTLKGIRYDLHLDVLQVEEAHHNTARLDAVPADCMERRDEENLTLADGEIEVQWDESENLVSPFCSNDEGCDGR